MAENKATEQDNLIDGGRYVYHVDRHTGEEQFEYIAPPPPDEWRTIRVSPAAFEAVLEVRNRAGQGEHRRDRAHQDTVASIMLLRDMDDPGRVDSIVQLVIDKKPEYRTEGMSTEDLIKALEQKLEGSGMDKDQLLQLLQKQAGGSSDAGQKSDDATSNHSTVTKGADKNAKSAS